MLYLATLSRTFNLPWRAIHEMNRCLGMMFLFHTNSAHSALPSLPLSSLYTLVLLKLWSMQTPLATAFYLIFLKFLMCQLHPLPGVSSSQCLPLKLYSLTHLTQAVSLLSSKSLTCCRVCAMFHGPICFSPNPPSSAGRHIFLPIYRRHFASSFSTSPYILST